MTALERACEKAGLTVPAIAKATDSAKSEIQEMLEGNRSIHFKVAAFLIENKINARTVSGKVAGRHT